jgi:ABC-2 type transport system permease protein
MMQTLVDTWIMTKRSLKHIVRSMDTIITVVLTPIAMMLLFVYIFGGAIGTQTGSVRYVNFIVPGILIMTVASGIAYAAVRLSMDLQKGIINRFRTMPVAPSSILGGQALSSTLSNLFSSFLVLMVAFIVGFRSEAGINSWLIFVALLILFTLATTWMAIFFGLWAKTMEGAGAFSYILLLLVFISPSFAPTNSMAPAIRGFAENQPITPLVETMRSLLVDGVPGQKIWIAIAWSLGILILFYFLSLRTYKKKTIVVNA